MHRQFADASLLDPLPDDVGPRKLAFRGGAIHTRRAPGGQTFLSPGHWITVMLSSSPGIKVSFADEPLMPQNAMTGALAVTPAGLNSKAEWSSPLENIIVSIAPESLRELAGHEFDRTDVELLPTHLTQDHTALQLAKLLKAELNRPEQANELYLDSLITMFGLHALRHYSNVAKPQRTGKGQMSKLAARTIEEYLRENFSRKLTVADLANVCGLSTGHFAEAFSKTFGVSPHRYVLELRINFAEQLLAQTELTFVEIAFLSGFSSQSHLTSILKAHRHKTPSQIRLSDTKRFS